MTGVSRDAPSVLFVLDEHALHVKLSNQSCSTSLYFDPIIAVQCTTIHTRKHVPAPTLPLHPDLGTVELAPIRTLLAVIVPGIGFDLLSDRSGGFGLRFG